MTSLYVLAQNNLLPDNQFMDTQTLKWIKTNAGIDLGLKLDFPKEIAILSLSNLSKVKPLTEWFDRREVDTIHGIRHLTRVSIYCLLLSNLLELSTINRNSLLVAASVHDIKRRNDKKDENHGGRAAEWFITNSYNLFRDLNFDEDLATFLIRNHEHIKASNRTYEDMLSVFKIADALDRYTQPKTEWWPDANYLSYGLPPYFFEISKVLVYMSELYFLTKKYDSYNSVIKAAQDLSIINKD